MVGLIYRATSQTTGKYYIGQTTRSLKRRIYNHKSSAKRGGTKFANAIRRYGIDDFVWEVVLSDIPVTYLNECEAFFISAFDSCCSGYNIDPIARQLHRGWKHYPETLIKIGAKSKGRTRSPEALKKCSESCKRALQNNPKVKANARKLVQLFGKPVICLDTGKVFPSAGEAARTLGLSNAKIGQVCLGKRKRTGGLRFAFYNKEDRRDD